MAKMMLHLMTMTFSDYWQVSVNDVAVKESKSVLQNGSYAKWRKPQSSKEPSSASTLRRRSGVIEWDQKSRDMGLLIDKWSRLIFPLSFTIFNVVYWLYYTQVI